MNSASPTHAPNCGVISPAPSSLAFYFNTIFLKLFLTYCLVLPGLPLESLHHQ